MKIFLLLVLFSVCFATINELTTNPSYYIIENVLVPNTRTESQYGLYTTEVVEPFIVVVEPDEFGNIVKIEYKNRIREIVEFFDDATPGYNGEQVLQTYTMDDTWGTGYSAVTPIPNTSQREFTASTVKGTWAVRGVIFPDTPAPFPAVDFYLTKLNFTGHYLQAGTKIAVKTEVLCLKKTDFLNDTVGEIHQFWPCTQAQTLDNFKVEYTMQKPDSSFVNLLQTYSIPDLQPTENHWYAYWTIDTTDHVIFSNWKMQNHYTNTPDVTTGLPTPTTGLQVIATSGAIPITSGAATTSVSQSSTTGSTCVPSTLGWVIESSSSLRAEQNYINADTGRCESRYQKFTGDFFETFIQYIKKEGGVERRTSAKMRLLSIVEFTDVGNNGWSSTDPVARTYQLGAADVWNAWTSVTGAPQRTMQSLTSANTLKAVAVVDEVAAACITNASPKTNVYFDVDFRTKWLTAGTKLAITARYQLFETLGGVSQSFLPNQQNYLLGIFGAVDSVVTAVDSLGNQVQVQVLQSSWVESGSATNRVYDVTYTFNTIDKTLKFTNWRVNSARTALPNNGIPTSTTNGLTTSPITSAALSTGAVTSSFLTTSPVTSSPLTTSPLTTGAITSGAVTSGEITSGSLTTSPLTTGIDCAACGNYIQSLLDQIHDLQTQLDNCN